MTGSNIILSHTTMCDRKFPTSCPLCQDRLEAQDEALRYNAKNAQLARSLGWTDIVELGESLLGRPVGGAPDSRDQAKIPDWCGDWQAAGALVAQYGVSVRIWPHGVKARIDVVPVSHQTFFGNHRDRATAIRHAIVSAVVMHLEFTKPFAEPSRRIDPLKEELSIQIAKHNHFSRETQ